jgi:hypothetical protein
MAETLTMETTQDDERLATLFRRALAREPEPAEFDLLKEFLDSQRKAFSLDRSTAEALTKVGNAPQATGTDTVDVAAWTMVVRAVLNAHETITRY